MCGKQRGCGRNAGSVARKELSGVLKRSRNQAARNLSDRAARGHKNGSAEKNPVDQARLL